MIMQFEVVETREAYEEIAAEEDAAARRRLFLEMLMPFDPLFAAFGVPLGGDQDLALQALGGWAFLMPEAIDERALDALEELERHRTWDLSRRTLEDVRDLFRNAWDRIPLQGIRSGIFLLDPARMDPVDRRWGYTGIGSVPGYAMLLYAEPNDYNMARIQATLAHECHHNIRLALYPWRPADLTVADHIVMEGMAEVFATETYGAETAGYYVTEIDDDGLRRAREAIGAALGARGFGTTRSYVYGDRVAAMGGERLGLPFFAGMAVGYRVVQQFLEQTGTGIVEATFLPADEIVRGSGYFDRN